MTEIQKLEAEIAEKRARLKQLKEEENPKLDYSLYKKYKPERYLTISSLALCGALRNFVLTISTAREYTKNGWHDYVLDFSSSPKLEKVSYAKIKVCNEMLAEIHPIYEKYIDIFLEMNKTEKLNGQ